MVELYTDGACRGNGTAKNATAGVGVVLIIDNNEPVFCKNKLKFTPNTNNKAEISAIITGINLLYEYYDFKDDDFVKDKLTIYSDSNYVIQGITKWIDGWRANGWKTANKTDVKNKELWQALDRMLTVLSNHFEIEFVKVKGHSGNLWNEKCDKLANQAIDEF